jgi:hypothetical protein
MPVVLLMMFVQISCNALNGVSMLKNLAQAVGRRSEKRVIDIRDLYKIDRCSDFGHRHRLLPNSLAFFCTSSSVPA